MINTKLLEPRNLIIIGLMSLTFTIFTKHIIDSVINIKKDEGDNGTK